MARSGTMKSDTTRTLELIRSLSDVLVIPVVTGTLTKYESHVSSRVGDAEVASAHA